MAFSKIILNGTTLMDVTGDTVASSNLLSGYTATGADGVGVNGSITSQGATTYYPSTSDQTISSGKYLSGTQTIKAVTIANLSAENIVNGVTVTVGDTADPDRIASVTGTAQTGGGGNQYVGTVWTYNTQATLPTVQSWHGPIYCGIQNGNEDMSTGFTSYCGFLRVGDSGRQGWGIQGVTKNNVSGGNWIVVPAGSTNNNITILWVDESDTNTISFLNTYFTQVTT